MKSSKNPHPNPLPAGDGVSLVADNELNSIEKDEINYRGGAEFSSLLEEARELRQKQTSAETSILIQ